MITNIIYSTRVSLQTLPEIKTRNTLPCAKFREGSQHLKNAFTTIIRCQIWKWETFRVDPISRLHMRSSSSFVFAEIRLPALGVDHFTFNMYILCVACVAHSVMSVTLTLCRTSVCAFANILLQKTLKYMYFKCHII